MLALEEVSGPLARLYSESGSVARAARERGVHVAPPLDLPPRPDARAALTPRLDASIGASIVRPHSGARAILPDRGTATVMSAKFAVSNFLD